MRHSGSLTRALLGCAVLAGSVLPASAATAQQMDMEVYNRWAPVVVVHYVIVGVYENDTAAVSQMASGSRAKAHVRDRFEIAFDWDQSEMSIVGTPVIKNSPSTIDRFTPYAGCGTPRHTGDYEHATYLSASTDGTGQLNIQVKRDFVAAVVDVMDDTGRCGATSVSIPAKSETKSGMLLIIPPTAYAMPSSAGVTLSADKKSLILPPQENWTLTYTLTPVR